MPETSVNSPCFTRTVPDIAALCWQHVPCAAMEVLRLLYSGGSFLTSFTSAPGCFVSHVTVKVCNKLLTLLHTFKQAGKGFAPQSILTAALKQEKIEKD